MKKSRQGCETARRGAGEKTRRSGCRLTISSAERSRAGRLWRQLVSGKLPGRSLAAGGNDRAAVNRRYAETPYGVGTLAPETIVSKMRKSLKLLTGRNPMLRKNGEWQA